VPVTIGVNYLVRTPHGRHLDGLGSMDPPRIVKCKNFALPASSNGRLYCTGSYNGIILALVSMVGCTLI